VIQERVTGVGILTRGLLWSLPCPHRHHHIYSLAAFSSRSIEGSCVEGFTTSLGRFVDRREALRLLPEHVKGRLEGKTELYSEDLW
jgi:hypothetical protein